MPTTIESLELEVQSSSTSATSGIDALSASLSKLKNAVKGGVGLTSVTNQLKGLNAALQGIDSSSAGKLDTLSNSLSKLSGLGNIKISPSIANQLKNIGTAATSLNGVDFSGIGKLPTALQPLTSLGKSNLTSFITQLGKLPQLAQTLNAMNIPQFASQLNQLSNALAPLATQLNTVSTAFSRLPTNIKRTVTATNAMTAANNTAAKSYVNLWAKLRMAKTAILGVTRVIASWLTESNKYIEDMNLFTASMGEYAESASKYAEQVGELMGIDPGEWMRNQGTFMTLIKGFGVAGDKANMMSRNLTQLAYDLASFENRPFEEAMQKVQSGIAGELEPLRRWGYDLSIARLQQEALRLGIDKSVQKMTQAEKAQLRYYAVMTQVTWAQGDMGRTLEAPANQLRILQAQLQQCSRAMGNLFLPILQKVLPYLIAFAKFLREIIVLFASVFNISLPEFDYGSITGAGGAMSDLSDAESEATRGAKKLKNALLGIDELNVLSKDSTSGSGSGGTVGGGDLGIELPDNDTWLEGITSKVDDLVKKFKEWAGLTDDIDTWAEFLHTKLGRILILVGEIAAGFLAWKFAKNFLNGLAWLQNLKTLGLTTPLTLAAGIILTITGLTIEWTGLVSIIQDGIDNLNLSETIGGAIMSTIGGAFIGKAASGLLAKAGITSAAIEGGMGAGLAGAIFGGSIAAIVAGIPAFVVGVWSAIKEGLNLLNGLLITGGATLTGAGIGALIGLLGGPIGAGVGALIGLVVGALTDFGIWLYQNWDSVSAWFSEKWKAVANFFTVTIPGWWNGTVVPFFQAIPDWFKGILESVRKWFVEKWTAVTDFMSGVPAKIGTAIEAVKQWFLSLPGKIGYALGFALGKIVSWVTDSVNYLKVKIPEMVEAVKKWFSELPGKIYTAISGAISKVVTWGSEMFSKFKEKVSAIVTNVAKWFSELPGKIYKAVSDTVSKISKWCSDMITKIKQELPKVIDKIVEFFKGIPDKLKQLGADIWNGLINGLKGAWTALTTAIKDFVDGFVQGFKDALGIHSPSTVFEDIGGDIIAGFKNGIELFTGMASTVKKWAGSVVEWFTKGKDGKGPVENFKETAGNVVSGFKDKIGSTYTSVKTNVTTWASKAKEWFSSSSFGGVNATTFSNFANNTIEGFKSKIGSAYTNTKSNITTWASNVKTWFTDNGYGGINNTNWQTFANNVVEGFKNKIGSAYTSSKSNITTWASNVKSWFSDIASNSAFSGFADNVINGFKNKIGSAYINAKSSMTTFANSVKNWFEKPDGSSLVSSFINIGKNIIQGFIDGVNSLWDKAMRKIKDFGKSIISKGKEGTEEHSPSKAFKRIGAFVIEGFNIGISDMMGSSFKLMNEWTSGITAYNPQLALAVDTSALSNFNPRAITDDMYAQVQSNYNTAVAIDDSSMREVMREAMLQALNESSMATDMRRQADKEEQTIVQVGNRTVTDAVTTQKKANGYVFAT